MRLIDADRLKIDFWFTWDDIKPTREEMFEIIDRQPTVEPKTGRWINANEGKWNTIEVLKCTACGEIDNRMYRTDSYCPNCGARMGGEGKTNADE